MEANEQHDHSTTPRGRTFLWGGIAAGLLLVALLLTHGFGLFAPKPSPPELPALVHQGGGIFTPENSPLRQQLTVVAAPAQPQSAIIKAPGIVESDPVRIVTVLP